MSRSKQRNVEGPEDGAPRRRGCWPLLLLLTVVAVAAGGAIAVLLTLAGEPNAIRMKIEPARAVVPAGQPFIVTVTIENVDLNAVTVSAIGFEQNLADGVSVTQMDPPYRIAKDRSLLLLGSWREYTLDRRVPGGDTLTITFTLVADQPGTYSGQVTVWVQGKLMGMSIQRARRATLSVEAS